MTAPKCLCGEINARHCPVHQDDEMTDVEKAARECSRDCGLTDGTELADAVRTGFIAGSAWRFEHGPERRALELAHKCFVRSVGLIEAVYMKRASVKITHVEWCIDMLAEIEKILGEK